MATLKYLISSGTWDWAGYYNGEAPAMYPSRFTPNTTGLVFTAIYDDGTRKTVTPVGGSVVDISPTHGGVSWQFSYTEGGVTVSTLVYMNTCGPLIFDKFTAQSLKNIAFSDSEVGIKRYSVGGAISYINTSSTNTYTFYDANGNVTSAPAVGTDCTGWTYEKTGNSVDKFYVLYPTTITDKCWGYNGIRTYATGSSIGSGKTNSETILAITDTSSYASNSIWKYIREMRTNRVNGCDDWYVGCPAEYSGMRVDKGDWFWSSREDDGNSGAGYAYAWHIGIDESYWGTFYKTVSTGRFCPLRSF